MRERIHERMQAEIQHEAKEAEAITEEMLDTPPAWNEVQNLMMENLRWEYDTGSRYLTEER